MGKEKEYSGAAFLLLILLLYLSYKTGVKSGYNDALKDAVKLIDLGSTSQK